MKRTILHQLELWRDKRARMPLLLKGARQVGKTYILQRFGERSFPGYHYFNFEENKSLGNIFDRDLNPDRILQELAFISNAAIDREKDLVVFDEIQECPKALTSLKYFQEDIPELALCAAGSLLGVQLNTESFPVGKVEFLRMFPLSFEEFLLGIGDEKSAPFLHHASENGALPEVVHDHLWRQLKTYFVVGGLPAVVNTFAEHSGKLLEAMTSVRKKQYDLITAYQADMAKHAGKQNAMHVERLWRGIPAQLARTQDGSGTKFRFKDAVPNVKGYDRLAGIIDWLQAAGLIIRVPIVNKGDLPFSAYVAENTFKLYFFDAGLLGAMSRLPPQTILDYDYGSYKGYFAENFAAQEFLCSGVEDLVSWKKRTAEVEFLREHNGMVLPIEIKSGWVTQAKSLKVFAAKYNPPYRTIMSAKNLRIEKDVHHYPLYMASRFPL